MTHFCLLLIRFLFVFALYLNSYILSIHTMNQRKPPALTPALRHRLTLEIRDEIVKLQNLLGRDLSHWF